MKKQIDEILMVIDDNACANISEDECDSKGSCAICRAERIYNAGYRKQSEGEWVMIPVNGVARYRCGNIECARLIPFGATPQELSYCPYCGAKMKGCAE